MTDSSIPNGSFTKEKVARRALLVVVVAVAWLTTMRLVAATLDGWVTEGGRYDGKALWTVEDGPRGWSTRCCPGSPCGSGCCRCRIG